MPEPTQPPASANLPADVARRLNEAFYGGSPHHYFEQRLVSLLATAAHEDLEALELPQTDALDDALGQKAEFDPDALGRTARELYVATECQVLLHHLAESMLRLVLGHLGDPPCPWIEIASLSDFREFKRRVKSEVLHVPADELRAQIKPLFLGTGQPANPKNGETGWTQTLLDNTLSFLRVLAHRLLDESSLYDAAKHGLALNADHFLVKMQLDTDDLDEEEREAARQVAEWFTFKGVILECLEWDRSPTTGQREWYRARRFIEVQHDLALAYGGVRVIGNLWAVARARYRGGGEVALRPLEGLTPKAIANQIQPRHGRLRVPIVALPLPEEAARQVMRKLDDEQADEP